MASEISWDAFPQVRAAEVPATEVVKRLFQLGYFGGKEWGSIAGLQFTSQPILDAVENYRDFHGNPAHNKIDQMMIGHMMLPRCALPDFMPAMERGARWPAGMIVTYSQRHSALRGLDDEQVRRLFEQSGQNWVAGCGIDLRYTDDFASANIYAEVDETGPGVLAWSGIPVNATQRTRIRQWFNPNTNWSEALYENTCCHEKGHGIGMGHDRYGTIMQPVADGKIRKPTAADFAHLIPVYGNPKPKPPKEEPPILIPPTSGNKIILTLPNLVAGQYELTLKSGNSGGTWDV